MFPHSEGLHAAIRDFSVRLMKCSLMRRMLLLAGLPATVLAAESVPAPGAAADGPGTPKWTLPAEFVVDAAGTGPQAWPPVRAEARPGSYWWWPGSAVTRDDLTWNLETYHQAGWGNMGAIAIYGVKGEEKRSIPLFSPEWFAMFNHAVSEGKRLGMNIDLTPSSGWRLGGPHIKPEHSERSFAIKDGKIVAVVRRDAVKRAAPGGEGPCVNPYSPAAVKFHFDWLAERFREGQGLSPRAFYYDSFENQGNWAPELPERFKRWRGYDLEKHAAALGGKGDPEEVRRVLCDYRETLSDMLLECVGWIAGWGAERGSGLRMQAHGAPANLLDMYAAASIPETELFGANHFDIPGFRREDRWCRSDPHSDLVQRFASSAAHVAGHKLIISESFTWLRDHFHVAPSHLKAEADRLLLKGINGIHYHGTCFSPRVTEWPGWLFYASSQVNARNSIFRDIPALNAYITRCQSMLQLGRPHNDILLYWPLHDLWMSGGKGEMRFTVHDPRWIEETACGKAANWLAGRGHSFDFISDKQLADVRMQDGALVTGGGNAYRTVLVPAAQFMKVDTLRRLLDLAANGATVAVWRQLPASVPGWHEHAAATGELRKLLDRLKFDKGVATHGKGRILLLDDLSALMDHAGIARESMADQGLRFIRRRLPGEVVYFIVNHTAKPVDGWVPVAAPCRAALVMDPMTGKLGKARLRHGERHAELYLQLAPGETRMLRVTEKSDIDAPPWPVLKQSGAPVAVSGPWDVHFVEGGPLLPAPATIGKLVSWTALEDPEVQRFAGAARYVTSVTLPENAAAKRWIIDLGDVRESARVWINGKPAGIVVAQSFRIDAGNLVQPGANKLEIEVTNLSANRIRDLDRRGVPWKKFHDINIVNQNYKPFDASDWPLIESGLLGPVTLLPFVADDGR